MTSLKIEGTPEEYGLDPNRLGRIGPHFDQYVADGRLPGWLATVARSGQLVWSGSGGHRDKEANLPVTDDTIWRIYSMTKPLTSIAVMMLYEEGRFDLLDDVGQWIEALREPRVYVSGPPTNPHTVAATEPVRVHHLLSHMSGLTYGFTYTHPVDAMYRAKGYEFGGPKSANLEQVVNDWCSTPLLFQPGSRWNYSVGVDVLGRLIELWSGQSIQDFFRERLLDPLGMDDTEWYCPQDKQDRLAMLYVPGKDGARPIGDMASGAMREPSWRGGGGGLVSTAHDYQRFMTFLVNGGEIDGQRLLSERTLALMTENHLPGDGDLAQWAEDSFSEDRQAGIGFGLGFSVVIDQRKNKSLASAGTFAWGGAASTAFWVDPVEELTVAFYTQLLPSSTYNIRRELQQLVYGALTD
jgi:CubicO group peptidase (beta-lactamase class C family)